MATAVGPSINSDTISNSAARPFTRSKKEKWAPCSATSLTNPAPPIFGTPATAWADRPPTKSTAPPTTAKASQPRPMRSAMDALLLAFGRSMCSIPQQSELKFDVQIRTQSRDGSPFAGDSGARHDYSPGMDEADF